MTDEVIERRMLLRGAGLAGATVIGGTTLAASAAAGDEEHSRVTGSWLVTHRDDPGGDPTEIMGVASFAAGGVVANQDISPISPTGLGSWKRRGRNGFRASLWAGIPGDGPGAPGLTLNVRLRGKVEDDEIEGTYAFKVFEPSGATAFEGTGTFEGERIKP